MFGDADGWGEQPEDSPSDAVMHEYGHSEPFLKDGII